MIAYEYYRLGDHDSDNFRAQAKSPSKARRMFLIPPFWIRSRDLLSGARYPKTSLKPRTPLSRQGQTRPPISESLAGTSITFGTQSSQSLSYIASSESDPFLHSSSQYDKTFRKLEQEVLSHLSTLEKTARLTSGDSTIGRSVYRNAVEKSHSYADIGRKAEIIRPITSPAEQAFRAQHVTPADGHELTQLSKSGNSSSQSLTSRRSISVTIESSEDLEI